MNKHPNFRIFVIGASAGGFRAIIECLDNFEGRADAAFIVVLHGFSESEATLAEHLGKAIKMPVSYAGDGMDIEAGKVFLSCPDYHLIVENGQMAFTKGPRENLFRPSIDVLFKSAAVHYGNRAVGVLLTGRLNDGALGLSAIQRCGGITIIQDPDTAEYSDMPLYAQRSMNPDFTLDLHDMSRLFNSLLEESLPPEKEIPLVLKKEVALTSHIGSLVNGSREEELSDNFSCPSCGGPLTLMEDEKLEHYRCRIGHSFTMESLSEGQDQQLEETLFVALRILDERIVLLKKMIGDYERKGLDYMARISQPKLDEVKSHAERLKKMIGLQE